MRKTRTARPAEIIEGRGYRIRARAVRTGVNTPSQLNLTLEVNGLAVDLSIDAEAAERLARVAAQAAEPPQAARQTEEHLVA